IMAAVHTCPYFALYEPIVPIVSIPFPSTVLLPRDTKTAGEPALFSPAPLSVTVELEIRTIATPVERLWAATAAPPWLVATQLSMVSSADEAVLDCAINPTARLSEATLLLSVTFEPSLASSAMLIFDSSFTPSIAADAVPDDGCTLIPKKLPRKTESF